MEYFNAVLPDLRQGAHVARREWAPGRFLALRAESAAQIKRDNPLVIILDEHGLDRYECMNHIDIVSKENGTGPWFCSPDDLQAKDWYVVPSQPERPSR